MGQSKWWYSKIILIWNRVRLSLRGKKIIVNQILFSKIYQNGNCKKEYTIFSGTGKNATSQTPRSTLHLEERTRYFRHWHTVKLYKNKMDTKVIKSYQSSLERSAVLIEINSEFWSLFRQKADLYRSTSHKNLQKQNNEDSFIQSLSLCLATYNQQQLLFPASIPIEEILHQPICLNPHTRLDFKYPPRSISDKFTIIRDLCWFLQPGLLISYTLFRKKLDFPTVNHKRYINF